MGYRLLCGDCLEIMPTLADGCADMILCDLPYGTTACSWDSVIPFEPLWAQYKRLIKPRGAVVLFGSQPFTSALVMSNVEWFKYCWVWEKSLIGDVMNAKNKPMKKHEDIAVFSNGTTANRSERLMIYNPQGITRNPVLRNNYYRLDGQATFKPRRPSHGANWVQEYTNYPSTILKFGNGNHDSFHPTQKPVDLLAYLIRTYTNPGETVIDNTMGSGSTGVAAIQEGRNFIGIERDEGYFAIAEKRIGEATFQPSLFAVSQNSEYESRQLFGEVNE